jgi:hypothetical protein
MSSTSNKPVYDPVYQHSDIDFEDRLQQHEEKKPWFSVSKEYVNWGLLLSTVAFAVLSLVLELGNPHYSYSGGFDIGAYTDLGAEISQLILARGQKQSLTRNRYCERSY